MAKYKCKACGSPDTDTKDSRPVDHGNVVRRRRSCRRCGARFTTYEVSEQDYKRIHETQDVALQGLYKIATIAEHAIRTRKDIDNGQRT